MVDFIQNLIGNEYLATFIMSFVPLIELKGAIVFGHGAGLQFIAAFLVSFIGSSLVFIPIYFLNSCVISFFDPLAFKGMLFNSQIFEYFPNISLLLINSLVLLRQEINPLKIIDFMI